MFDQIRYHKRLLVLFSLLFACVFILLHLLDDSSSSSVQLKCNLECNHQRRRSLHNTSTLYAAHNSHSSALPDDIDLSIQLIHLDLKGAPPRIAYLNQLFPLLSQWGVSGVLIEYEDMFPYDGRLFELRNSAGSYSRDDIREIQTIAERNNLIVVPLVQSESSHTLYNQLCSFSIWTFGICAEAFVVCESTRS